MIIGEGGYVVYHFNNGDKQIIESKTGKSTWEYASEEKKLSMLERFQRWRADNNDS